MRRYNTKNSKMNDPTGIITKLMVGVIVGGVCVALGWLTIDIKNKQITKEVDDIEREYTKLSKEHEREAKRWKAQMTRENLDAMIARNLLTMRHPNPETQVVYLNATGRTISGQPSVLHITKVLEKVRGAKASNR